MKTIFRKKRLIWLALIFLAIGKAYAETGAGNGSAQLESELRLQIKNIEDQQKLLNRRLSESRKELERISPGPEKSLKECLPGKWDIVLEQCVE